MIQIIVDNSQCQLIGISNDQYISLRNILSYTATKHRHKFRSYLLTKRLNFPTGILYLVIKYLKDKKLPFTTQDLRKAPIRRPERFLGKFRVTPYPEQNAAAEAAIAFKRGIIVAPTGVGKTLITALIIQKLGVSALVIVPSLGIKVQTLQTLKNIFGDSKVSELEGLAPIVVVNVDALDPKKPIPGYDCVIIDEFHHSGAKTYRTLNKHAWSKVYYKFGLTATPFRSQDEERLLLESVLSHEIYRIRYQDAVDKGYIVPLEAYYIELPTAMPEGYTWPEIYSELIVSNYHRNKIIVDLLRRLKDKSTLCLVKEIKHGEELQRLSPGLEFIKGEDKEHLDSFNSGHIKTIIATIGVMGEGIDTRPCEYVIIAGLGKSKNAFMQQCGRAFRNYLDKESGKIILFKDRSHKWTLSHFNAQVRYLKQEYGIKPCKIDLT